MRGPYLQEAYEQYLASGTLAQDCRIYMGAQSVAIMRGVATVGVGDE